MLAIGWGTPPAGFMFLRGKHTPSVCLRVSSSCTCSVLHHLFSANVEAVCMFSCQGQHAGQPVVLVWPQVSADQHLIISSKKAAVGTLQVNGQSPRLQNAAGA